MFERLFATPQREYPSLPFGLNDDPVTRVWIMGVGFLLAVLVVIMPANYFDARLFNGISLWHKPTKFALSLLIHFATLAWLAQQLELRYRKSITLIVVGYSAVAAMLFEQVYITLQAARGRGSHFNYSTDLESALYGVMGLGAILLVLASFVLGIMIWRKGTQDGSGLRLGSIVGLLLGSVLTLCFGIYMSSQPSHLVQQAGEVVNDAGGLPIVGWSRAVGDLRIPHFVATHMMQVLPLVGLGLDKLKLPVRGVLIGLALIMTLICVVLLNLAISGQPLF